MFWRKRDLAMTRPPRTLIPSSHRTGWIRAWGERCSRPVRGRNYARCVVCGLRICSDDATGLLFGNPAHAECAFVHRLESLRPGRDTSHEGPPFSTVDMTDEQWQALINALSR